MTRFVLVSDTTLSYEYRNFPLLDFLPCAPGQAVPGPVYKFLKGPAPPVNPDGSAVFCTIFHQKTGSGPAEKIPKERRCCRP